MISHNICDIWTFPVFWMVSTTVRWPKMRHWEIWGLMIPKSLVSLMNSSEISALNEIGFLVVNVIPHSKRNPMYKLYILWSFLSHCNINTMTTFLTLTCPVLQTYQKQKRVPIPSYLPSLSELYFTLQLIYTFSWRKSELSYIRVFSRWGGGGGASYFRVNNNPFVT